MVNDLHEDLRQAANIRGRAVGGLALAAIMLRQIAQGITGEFLRLKVLDQLDAVVEDPVAGEGFACLLKTLLQDAEVKGRVTIKFSQ